MSKQVKISRVLINGQPCEVIKQYALPIAIDGVLDIGKSNLAVKVPDNIEITTDSPLKVEIEFSSA